MGLYNFSTVIFCVFLIASFAISLLAVGKIKNLREYSFGNEVAISSLSIAIGAVLAELNQGYILELPRNILLNGKFVALVYIGITISYFMRAFIFAPRMKKFVGFITAGEILKETYGYGAQVFYGCVSLIYGICYTVIQLYAIGAICEFFWGFERHYIQIIICFSIISYLAIGGMKAMRSTIFFQFILIVLTLFIVSSMCLIKVKSIDDNLQMVSLIESSITDFDKKYYFILVIMNSFFQADLVSPSKFQSLLINCGKRKLVKSFLYTALLHVLIVILLVIIGISFVSLTHKASLDNIILNLIYNFFSIDMRFLIGISLISILITSLAYNLNSTSLVFVNDILQNFNNFSRNFTSIYLFRLSIIFLGVISLILLLLCPFSIKMEFIIGLIQITVSSPIILRIFDLKISTKNFWIAAISGLLACVFYHIIYGDSISLNGVFLGIIVSNILTIYSIIVKYKSSIIEVLYSLKYQGPTKIKSKLNSSIRFLYINLYKLLSFKSDYISKNFIEYRTFAFFYIVWQLSHYFFVVAGIYSQINLAIELKNCAILIWCLFIIMQNFWKRNNKWIQLFLHIILIYSLVFVPFTVFAISGGTVYYALDCAISIMILIYLIAWEKFFVMLAIGTTLSYFFVKKFLFYDLYKINEKTALALVYLLVISLAIVLIFSRNRQKKINFLEYKAKFLSILERERNKEVIALESSHYKSFNEISGGALDLIERLKYIKSSLVEEKNIKKTISEVDILIEYFNSIFSGEVNYYKLEVYELDIEVLINEVKYFLDVDIFENITIVNNSSYKKIFCDHIGFLRIMSGFVEEFIHDMHKRKITFMEDMYIIILDSKIQYYIKEFPKYDKTLDSIRFVFSTNYDPQSILELKTSKVELVNPESILPVSFGDMSQSANTRVIEAHYAQYLDISDDSNICKLYNFPVNVYDIRPYLLDLNSNNQISLWEDSLEIENEFLKHMRQYNCEIHIDYVKEAIKFIKNYYPMNYILSNNNFFYKNALELAKLSFKILAADRNSNIYSYISNYRAELLILCVTYKIFNKTLSHPIIFISKFGNVFGKSFLELLELDSKKIHPDINIIVNNEFTKLSILSKCVIVCDRLYLLYNIDAIESLKEREEIALSNKCYVRMAMVLGLYDIAKELDNLSNKILVS